MHKLFLLVIEGLFFCHGCTSLPEAEKTEFIAVNNGCFKAVLLNPEMIENDKMFGCRFIRAGWIKELYLKGTDTSIFRPNSVFKNHPTFGYTHEILPQLDLKLCKDRIHAERLNIGVGIVKQNIKNRFKIEPIKIFPWQTVVRKENEKTVIESRQITEDCNGYSYIMTVRTIFTKDSPVIEFEQMLENTGSKDLFGTAYVHPFFNAVNGLKNCWCILPHRTNTKMGDRKFADTLPMPVSKLPELVQYEKDELATRDNWVAAGNFLGKNCRVYIYSD